MSALQALTIVTVVSIALELISAFVFCRRRTIFPIPYRFKENLVLCVSTIGWQLSFLILQYTGASVLVRRVCFMIGMGVILELNAFSVWKMWVQGKISAAIQMKLTSGAKVYEGNVNPPSRSGGSTSSAANLPSSALNQTDAAQTQTDTLNQAEFELWINRRHWSGGFGIALIALVGTMNIAILCMIEILVCVLKQDACTYPDWILLLSASVLTNPCTMVAIKKASRVREGLYLKTEIVLKFLGCAPLFLAYLGIGLSNNWQYADFAHTLTCTALYLVSTIFPVLVSYQHRERRKFASDTPSHSGPPVVAVELPSIHSRKTTTTHAPDVEDFEILLDDKVGFDAFSDFLCSEFSGEHALFLKAHKEFMAFVQGCQALDVHPAAMAMVNMFIQVGAPLEVNLCATTRNAVLENASQMEVSPNVFQDAVHEISSLVKHDSFQRFKHTREYAKYLKSTVEARRHQQNAASESGVVLEDAFKEKLLPSPKSSGGKSPPWHQHKK